MSSVVRRAVARKGACQTNAHDGPPSLTSLAGMKPRRVCAALVAGTGTFIRVSVDETACPQSTCLWPPRIAALYNINERQRPGNLQGSQGKDGTRHTSSVSLAAVRTAPASFSPKPPLAFFLSLGPSSDVAVDAPENIDSATLSVSSIRLSGVGGGGGGGRGCWRASASLSNRSAS